MNVNILIYSANLHCGGGVSVATSFIKELSSYLKENNTEYKYHILVSNKIHENLMSMKVDIDVFESYKIKNYYGLESIYKGIDLILFKYDKVFTVFGPLYSIFKPRFSYIGFAQPWMIYPKSRAWDLLTKKEKVKLRVKFYLQKRFFSRADNLIVELPHVKKGIDLILKNKKVSIVNSCIDSIYFDENNWKEVKLKDSKSIKIGLISRNYPHKNLNFFIDVKDKLKERGWDNIEFFVTLPDNEMSTMSNEFKKNINNVGPLTLDQCPYFYREMDAVLFPTILECFSSVTVETLFMSKPLFASDLPFIRDCCAENAIYYQEGNPAECAEKIIKYFSGEINIDIEKAKKHALQFGDSKRRAIDYIKIIES